MFMQSLGEGRMSLLAPADYPTLSPLPATTRPPPQTSAEWLNLAVDMLALMQPETAERTLQVCVEAANILLDTATRQNTDAVAQRRSQQQINKKLNGEDLYSPREGPDDEEDPPSARIQAMYLLVAGSMAAIALDSPAWHSEGVHLAQLSVEAFHCPMTAAALAWANCSLFRRLSDASKQETARTAGVAAASSGAAMLLDDNVPVTELPYLARMAWSLAMLGEGQLARMCTNKVLQSAPTHYTGLLLHSLLHTAGADYEHASVACQRGLQVYPESIAMGLLYIVVRQLTAASKPSAESSCAKGSSSGDLAAEELAVMLARVQQYAKTAKGVDDSLNKRRTLRTLATYCAPGEEVEGGVMLSAAEMKYRAAWLWALLADVSITLGAYDFADIAIEAGLDYVAASPVLYRKPFADLLCCRARVSLIQVHERMPRRLKACELNLLGLLHPTAPTKAARDGLSYSLYADVRGVANETDISGLSNTNRFLNPRELEPIVTYLLKAAEIYPGHTTALYLMGTARLLEASQPDLPRSDHVQRLLEAGNYFLQAVRAAPMQSRTYLGLGCVREAEGATEVALDLYASAAELALEEPIVPFTSFAFLFGGI